MHGDGSLNLARIGDYARHLATSRVAGVFVCGTTGEGQSLTVEERIAVAESWAHESRGSKLELIIHVGHNSQAEAARLATHAQSIGADAIAMHAPTWYKLQSLADLIEFCVPVAAAAPKLRFYLYDIPSVTGVQLSSAEFLTHARRRIATLAGLKYTNVDFVTVQECIQMNHGEFDILWGCDDMLLPAVALGVSGAVGTTYNFAAPLYCRMLDAAEAGDWQQARAEQARAVAMIRICQKYGGLAAFKFIMSLAGIDCGPARPPVGKLLDDDKRRLRTEFVDSQVLSSSGPVCPS
jgi:N-acetylneuraminate lyase